MKKIFLFVLYLLTISIYSQEVKSIKLKKYFVGYLSDSLQENSGLDFLGTELITFNDGGNSSELFFISKTNAKIKKSISTGLLNKDWEAIASDEHYIYIGDFGNNGGSRIDLAIHKIPIPKDSLSQNEIQSLPFYYPEQKDFTFKNLHTDFDAESMIFHNGKLHIFTKEWLSKGVAHYILDVHHNQPQPAQKIEYFPIGFMVTDAAYFNHKLYLVGYSKNLKAYLHIFEESPDGYFFNGKHNQYKIGNLLKIGQIEAIAVDSTGIYISGEKFIFPLKTVRQSLYFIPFGKEILE